MAPHGQHKARTRHVIVEASSGATGFRGGVRAKASVVLATAAKRTTQTTEAQHRSATGGMQ